jgi:hypothetical protein
MGTECACNNIVEIKYLGKCLKYRDAKDRNDKLGDSYNCLEGEELAKKSILIEVKIARPEALGTYQEKKCDK